MRKKILTFLALFALINFTNGQLPLRIQSPDKSLTVLLQNKDGKILYSVTKDNSVVIEPSVMGLDFREKKFSENLSIVSFAKPVAVQENYLSKNAKRSVLAYKANKATITVHNKEGKAMQIIFQVSNDGVAFRYFFPWIKNNETIIKEHSAFTFSTEAKGWLQPMSIPKTGWEQCHPSYEERYMQNIPVGTMPAQKAGWVYPALFYTNNNWVLITEAGLDGSYCGSKLINDSTSSTYTVGFPDAREVFTGRGHLPVNNKPWFTPWRIITVGSLKTITESTLGTDVAPGAAKRDWSFVKPGKSSWSWISSKDNMIVYHEQKKYVDFAAGLKWQYCLVDVNWDTKIGYDSIKILADYAAQKNVGLILWYNSAGDWNTVKYHPKDLLLTSDTRQKEFSRLRSMGIKGVKIDFFGGDGQSMIRYYIDILNDAAKYNLLVNFHGATLPRGWHKTYPHLVTAEAIYGMEMVTFSQEAADKQPSHCTLLPFTRNAFDPMDFTPMNLTGLTHSKSIRKTTPAFELALSVLFLSGIQHFAQNPEHLDKLPFEVINYLQNIPDHWDDVKFIDGYPGKFIVLARRSGNKWYVAGINGENEARKIVVDLAPFKKGSGQLFGDTDEKGLFRVLPVFTSGKMALTMKPSGGFVAVLE